MKNYYAILDIAKTATQKEIRSAYIRKAKLYHPDVNSTPNAAARFKEVQEAYNTLYDREKRQAYDASHAFGSASSASGGRTAYYSGTGGRGSRYHPHHDTSSSFEDQFRAEAEQLRRQWHEMETDKLRRGAEKFKTTFTNDGFPGGVRFIHIFPFTSPYKLRFIFYLLRKIAPLIILPLSFLFFCASEVMSNIARKNAKIHIVYDSYGRAYTYDVHGRRCRAQSLLQRILRRSQNTPRILWWQASEILYKLQRRQRNDVKQHPCVATWHKLVRCMRRFPHNATSRCAGEASRHYQCTVKNDVSLSLSETNCCRAGQPRTGLTMRGFSNRRFRCL
ncbi:domain containing protein [Babesia ovata]|uniref:Domain containing protein n=1 Tax=Babesia ovata TaxID=189622 RepID=A0A2H6KBB4_9APIC|nr:domain containing protein [Babesia ovata]GBE60281.1 domain containing protein [Babesia ovata]